MSTFLKEEASSQKTIKCCNPSELTIEKIPVKGYELVLKVTHAKSKLTAIISIHNTVLGNALGGTRIFPYASFDAALVDALRLSQAMTYKAAVAEVGFGGGKSVIIADPKVEKTPELLLAFAAAVDSLQGTYICAEDVGTTLDDMLLIRKATRYVTGLPGEKGSGDPGWYTGWGTFRGVQSVLKKCFGSESVEGKKVAVLGLGNVGQPLVHSLFWAGADLIISDIDAEKTKKLAAKYGCKVVSPKEIFQVECDVLSPCAMGGLINDETIPQFRCKAIAGCANNQLLRNEHADLLKEKGILYAPDFVINAGGLINVAYELTPEGYHPQAPREKTHKIYDTLLSIYEISEKNNISTHQAAISLGDYRIKYGIGKRREYPYFHPVKI